MDWDVFRPRRKEKIYLIFYNKIINTEWVGKGGGVQMGENTENTVSRLCQKVEKSVLKEYVRILRKNGDNSVFIKNIFKLRSKRRGGWTARSLPYLICRIRQKFRTKEYRLEVEF